MAKNTEALIALHEIGETLTPRYLKELQYALLELQFSAEAGSNLHQHKPNYMSQEELVAILKEYI